VLSAIEEMRPQEGHTAPDFIAEREDLPS